jgi:multidrug efflux pump subunit AcrA (membrane-fusion protein)
MMPGMSASGVLRLQTGHKEVVVPRDALMRYPDGRVTVWVVNDNGGKPTVSEHRVTTGLSFSGRVAIVTGLDDGARVVLQGNEALKEGQAVAIRRDK